MVLEDAVTAARMMMDETTKYTKDTKKRPKQESAQLVQPPKKSACFWLFFVFFVYFVVYLLVRAGRGALLTSSSDFSIRISPVISPREVLDT
jgi:hypothetical protein